MGIYYKRHNIVKDISTPQFEDIFKIYYGATINFPASLKIRGIKRIVFSFDNNVFQYHHHSRALRHQIGNSIVSVDQLNYYNNLKIEPRYDNSYGKKSNYKLDSGKPYTTLITKLINNNLPELILTPKNGEFYFVEGIVRQWLKDAIVGYEWGYQSDPPIIVSNKDEFNYTIYRYGVCNVESIILQPSGNLRKEQFTYKIVKTIDRGIIPFNQLKNYNTKP